MPLSRQDWIDTHSDEAPPVPLPSEVPAKLDFSNLPLPVLRSGSIEALIAQNEDLMARLNVTLRRLAIIEEQSEATSGENLELKRQLENLSDQLLVRQKKDEYWKQHLLEAQQRSLHLQDEVTRTQEELSLAEMRFAELYSASEAGEEEFNQKLDRARTRILTYQKYRQRMRILANRLRSALAQSRAEMEAESLLNQDLRERVQGLVEHIQQEQREHTEKLGLTVSSYEAQLDQARANEETQQQALTAAQERIAMLDRLIMDQVELENRAIHAEKRLSQVQEDAAANLEGLKAEHLKLRRNFDLVSREHVAVCSEKEQLSTRSRFLEGENTRLKDQVEGLQTMWDETRKRLESLSTKEQALQKLNQELSGQLSQLRKERSRDEDALLIEQKLRS